MKINRYLDGQGQAHYGVRQPDGATLTLDGDPYGDFRVGSQPADVRKLLAPVQPTAIIGIGLNYRFHAEETKSAIPEHPIVFMKLPGAVQNPGDPILLPRQLRSDRVDYEAELAVVIGKTARNVRREQALDHVLGYTCGNDVSARDWQMVRQKKQWARGKSFDTFCPLGPYLVTKDEIPDPNDLRIRSILNGKVMQDSSTSDMLFSVAQIVSDLSCSMTLLPGTVIMTGTPEGVGFVRKPPVFLRHGDVFTIDIERLGVLTNPVEREP